MSSITSAGTQPTIEGRFKAPWTQRKAVEYDMHHAYSEIGTMITLADDLNRPVAFIYANQAIQNGALDDADALANAIIADPSILGSSPRAIDLRGYGWEDSILEYPLWVYNVTLRSEDDTGDLDGGEHRVNPYDPVKARNLAGRPSVTLGVRPTTPATPTLILPKFRIVDAAPLPVGLDRPETWPGEKGYQIKSRFDGPLTNFPADAVLSLAQAASVLSYDDITSMIRLWEAWAEDAKTATPGASPGTFRIVPGMRVMDTSDSNDNITGICVAVDDKHVVLRVEAGSKMGTPGELWMAERAMVGICPDFSGDDEKGVAA